MKTFFAAAVLSLAVVAAPPTTVHSHALTAGARFDATLQAEPTMELRLAMRTLWEDHITYTRNFIISALASLPDQEIVTQRLLRNQDDIGAAIRPYYGDDAGKKLSALLRDHILIAADVVNAAKDGATDALAEAQRKWSANGKEIAAFLSGANPHLQKKMLEEMLQKHLDLTTGEVVARLSKDWAGDIKAYDDGHVHMLMFADALTAGIVKQFPDKFSTD